MGWPKGVKRKPQGAAETSPLSISPEPVEAIVADTKSPAPAAVSSVKVKVIRDFWREEKPDGTEDRVVAGSIIEVSVDAAFDGIEAGMFERHKGG
jgi:hypothetical protein